MQARRIERRRFLADVGRGMLAAGAGFSIAGELGLGPILAEDAPAAAQKLTFGSRERLVGLLAETPPDRLLPLLVKTLRAGTELKELVAAGALLNARAFGGEDYIGFHTFMAMAPAYRMALEMPPERRALPVLKVLYRNAARLHETGGAAKETLRPVDAPAAASGPGAAALREAVHRRDLPAAEGVLAAAARGSAEQAFNDLLETVQEAPEVHRIVLAHRAWDMLELAGKDEALTLLRQSLHYCVRNDVHRERHYSGVGQLLAKLLEEHKLLGKPLGRREVDDAWVDRTSQAIFNASAEQAAALVAASLAEGVSAEAIGEAISLCGNQLVLRDAGRPASQSQPNKPVGSVHGDSIGVHACDSIHAWRSIARSSNDRNAMASLILAGYQVARDRVDRGGDFLEWKPRPYVEELAKLEAREPARLLTALETAIRAQDQNGACAASHRYCELGHERRGLLDVLRRFAISEDGALHSEKYYATTTSEHAAGRPCFRDRQLVALARVMASQYGMPAPGYAEACDLLAV